MCANGPGEYEKLGSTNWADQRRLEREGLSAGGLEESEAASRKEVREAQQQGYVSSKFGPQAHVIRARETEERLKQPEFGYNEDHPGSNLMKSLEKGQFPASLPIPENVRRKRQEEVVHDSGDNRSREVGGTSNPAFIAPKAEQTQSVKAEATFIAQNKPTEQAYEKQAGSAELGVSKVSESEAKTATPTRATGTVGDGITKSSSMANAAERNYVDPIDGASMSKGPGSNFAGQSGTGSSTDERRTSKPEGDSQRAEPANTLSAKGLKQEQYSGRATGESEGRHRGSEGQGSEEPAKVETRGKDPGDEYRGKRLDPATESDTTEKGSKLNKGSGTERDVKGEKPEQRESESQTGSKRNAQPGDTGTGRKGNSKVDDWKSGEKGTGSRGDDSNSGEKGTSSRGDEAQSGSRGNKTDGSQSSQNPKADSAQPGQKGNAPAVDGGKDNSSQAGDGPKSNGTTPQAESEAVTSKGQGTTSASASGGRISSGSGGGGGGDAGTAGSKHADDGKTGSSGDGKTGIDGNGSAPGTDGKSHGTTSDGKTSATTTDGKSPGTASDGKGNGTASGDTNIGGKGIGKGFETAGDTRMDADEPMTAKNTKGDFTPQDGRSGKTVVPSPRGESSSEPGVLMGDGKRPSKIGSSIADAIFDKLDPRKSREQKPDGSEPASSKGKKVQSADDGSSKAPDGAGKMSTAKGRWGFDAGEAPADDRVKTDRSRIPADQSQKGQKVPPGTGSPMSGSTTGADKGTGSGKTAVDGGTDRRTGADRSPGADRTIGTDRAAGAGRATGSDRATGTDRAAGADRATGADGAAGSERATGGRVSSGFPLAGIHISMPEFGSNSNSNSNSKWIGKKDQSTAKPGDESGKGKLTETSKTGAKLLDDGSGVSKARSEKPTRAAEVSGTLPIQKASISRSNASIDLRGMDGKTAANASRRMDGRSVADASGRIDGRSVADASRRMDGRSVADASGRINSKLPVDAGRADGKFGADVRCRDGKSATDASRRIDGRLHEDNDAFDGHMPEIKLTYGKLGQIANAGFGQAANVPARGGITGDAVSAKGGIAGDAPLKATQPTGKLSDPNARGELDPTCMGSRSADSAKARQKDGDTQRSANTTQDAGDRQQIRNRFTNKGGLAPVKGGINRGIGRAIDKGNIKDEQDLETSRNFAQNARPRTIREILSRFNIGTPRRDFKPEITESGTYSVQQGQSSQRLQAFSSSGQHKAIQMQSNNTTENLRIPGGARGKRLPQIGDREENILEDENESILKAGRDRSRLGTVHGGKGKSGAGSESMFEGEESRVAKEMLKGEDPELAEPLNGTPDDVLLTLKESIGVQQFRKSSRQDEQARRLYIVQEGETPESIAVVELNDESLSNLIREINQPLFQRMYDIYKQEHVDVLPAGTMILLPNNKDIHAYRARSSR